MEFPVWTACKQRIRRTSLWVLDFSSVKQMGWWRLDASLHVRDSSICVFVSHTLTQPPPASRGGGKIEDQGEQGTEEKRECSLYRILLHWGQVHFHLGSSSRALFSKINNWCEAEIQIYVSLYLTSVSTSMPIYLSI